MRRLWFKKFNPPIGRADSRIKESFFKIKNLNVLEGKRVRLSIKVEIKMS